MKVSARRVHGHLLTATDAQVTVVRAESVRNILQERRMLQHLKHPFICNLRYSFQDVEYLYVIFSPGSARRRSKPPLTP